MRTILLVLFVGAAACAPAASSPSASPSAVTSVTPAATTAVPSATPSATPASTSTSGTSATPIPLPSTAQVAAAGNGVVWALVADTHLFRSTDRGTTWAERSLPPGAGTLQVAFVNDVNGFAIRLSPPATQCQAQGVATYRTTDGAATWLPVGASADTAQCKTSLAFVDTTHGYMTSSDPNHAPSIWRTTDGGATWLASQLPDPPGFTTTAGTSLQAGNVADFGNVLFADAFGPVSGVMKHFVYRSTDRGATWSYTSTALQSTSIVFLTPTRWLQIFLPNDSRVTTDGGQTWAFFASDYSQAAPVDPQIVFGDANTGYASVRGSIQRTTDGGAHWTAIRTPGT